MTDEEIAVEYEAQMAWDGESLKKCPKCGEETIQKCCPYCTPDRGGITLTGNSTLDNVIAMVEDGKVDEIEDLEAVLRGGFISVQRQAKTENRSTE